MAKLTGAGEEQLRLGVLTGGTLRAGMLAANLGVHPFRQVAQARHYVRMLAADLLVFPGSSSRL